MTIKVKGIDHVVLRTSDLERMLAFYRDLLACPVERELPDLGLVQLRAGTALIDLVPVDSVLGRAGGKAPSRDGRNMEHLCLCIEPQPEPELLNLLRAVDPAVGEFQERYGAEGFGRSVYVNDPEGNIVELKFARS